MRVRYAHVLLIVEVILIITLASRGTISAKENNNSKQQQQQQQPLAGVDKMFRQVNGNLSQFDSVAMSNMTNVLNEMAANLRKMFSENKKIQQQMQEVLNRVSNNTGINATNAMTNIQQQAANVPMNITSVGSFSNLLPRLQTN